MRLCFVLLQILTVENVKCQFFFEDEKFGVDEDLLPDNLVIYKSKYEIVNLMAPLNTEELIASEEYDDNDHPKNHFEGAIFFVKADLKKNGKVIEKGLFVLNGKEPKKLLNKGRDAVRDVINNRVYFGAKNGMYAFNEDKLKAEKYGNITENIRFIEKERDSEVFYVVNDKNKVYKITRNGTRKVKVDKIDNAKQLVVDSLNKIYFYDNSNDLFVYDGKDVMKIFNVPANKTTIKLVRIPSNPGYGAAAFIDGVLHIIDPTGVASTYKVNFDKVPTAYNMENGYIHFCAIKKKIYRFNILSLLV